jgi:hypothetical protein
MRWLWVVAVVAVFGVTAATRWPSKPLPPPVVSLSLVGFKVVLTNTYAVMAMTNLGPTKTYFRGSEWRAEFETTLGMVANRPCFRRSLPYPRRHGEGHTFSVGVPDGVIRWRVVAWHEWVDRHNPRIEIVECLEDHVDEGRLQDVVETVLGPVLGQRPDKFDLYNFTATPWLTNLPPSTILPE